MTYQDRDPRFDDGRATRRGTGWIIGLLVLLAIVATGYFMWSGANNNTASNNNTGRPAASTPNTITNTTGTGTPAPSPTPSPNR